MPPGIFGVSFGALKNPDADILSASAGAPLAFRVLDPPLPIVIAPPVELSFSNVITDLARCTTWLFTLSLPTSPALVCIDLTDIGFDPDDWFFRCRGLPHAAALEELPLSRIPMGMTNIASSTSSS